MTPSTSSPFSGPPPSPLYLILSSPPLLTVPDICLLALSSSRQVINNRAHFFASCPQRPAFFSHLRNHGKIIFLLRTWHSPSHQGSEQDPQAHVPIFVFTTEHTPTKQTCTRTSTTRRLLACTARQDFNAQTTAGIELEALSSKC